MAGQPAQLSRVPAAQPRSRHQDVGAGAVGLRRTGFDVPGDPVTGWDGGAPVPTGYPRARRPNGGLWSCVDDLLTFAGQLLAALARRSEDLPAIAGILSDLQQPLTGDELPRALDAFAA